MLGNLSWSASALSDLGRQAAGVLPNSLPESQLYPGYDEGALLDELVRLKIFVIEHRDFDAWLVPATSASAAPKKAKASPKDNLTVTVDADVAEQIRNAAKRRGVSVASLLAPVLTEFAATA